MRRSSRTCSAPRPPHHSLTAAAHFAASRRRRPHSPSPPLRSCRRRYLPEAFTNASVAAQAAVSGRALSSDALKRHYLLKVAFGSSDLDVARYAVHIDAATDVPAHAISHRISPTATPTTYVPLFWVTDYDETPEDLRPTAFACTVTCEPASLLTMLAGGAAELSADSFAAMQTFLASFDFTPLHYTEYCARHHLTAYVPVDGGRD